MTLPLKDTLSIRPVEDADRTWVATTIKTRWGGDVVVGHGTIYQPATLPGYIAWSGEARVGLVTYHPDNATWEIVTLDSLHQGKGIGTALLGTVVDAARVAGAGKLWLITTNDNLRALRFYQRRGFHLSALYPNAVTQARRIKPAIPLVGENGIPLCDELELSMDL
jgi:GNAT superfamily N-acetyltransferase